MVHGVLNGRVVTDARSWDIKSWVPNAAWFVGDWKTPYVNPTVILYLFYTRKAYGVKEAAKERYGLHFHMLFQKHCGPPGRTRVTDLSLISPDLKLAAETEVACTKSVCNCYQRL